jgi:hypothetical protein
MVVEVVLGMCAISVWGVSFWAVSVVNDILHTVPVTK